MSAHQTSIPEPPAARIVLHNGSGAAALLAAGIGAIVLAVLDVTADHVGLFKSDMIFYKPTGPLSGVTTSAIIAWLIIWISLDFRWKKRNVALGRVVAAALVLLVLALVLTFPPVAHLF